MRKRLRKKLHLNEFCEWGVPVGIRFTEGVDRGAFLDEFVIEGLMPRDCRFEGVLGEETLTGVVELGMIAGSSEPRVDEVKAWLDARGEVSYVIGGLMDVWYGPFDELDKVVAELG